MFERFLGSLARSRMADRSHSTIWSLLSIKRSLASWKRSSPNLLGRSFFRWLSKDFLDDFHFVFFTVFVQHEQFAVYYGELHS